MQWLNLFNLTVGILFSVCYLYQYVYIVISLLRKPKRYPEAEKRCRYAVLVSARNEEAVIGQLCDSIRSQDYPKELIDICVVADNCTDRTRDIALAHGATVYERQNKDAVGKCYAIDHLLKSIWRDKGQDFYDGYFILDADNLLDPHYVTEMNKAFCAGYRIVTSYRNSKNYGDNWISSGYALWFMRESRHLNNVRSILGTGCVVTGTGFLVHKDIFKEQGGWIHTCLTEDIEFTAHHLLKSEKITYCNDAIFYDEQPVKFSQSWHQRKRWVKGYLQILGKYTPRLIKRLFRKGDFSVFDLVMSLSPAFFLSAISAAVNLAALLYAAVFLPALVLPSLMGMLTTLAGAYLLFLLVSALTVFTERKRIHASTLCKILSVITTPIFIATYVPVSISALFSRVEWKPIEHRVSVSLNEVKEQRSKGKRRNAP